MAFVSVTRLRVRSFWTLPWFLLAAAQSYNQARAAEGNLSAEARAMPKRVFWTLSVWRDEAAMAAYRGSGAHGRILPKLMAWCDEASVAHWTQESETAPDWASAEARMRDGGRVSRVKHPSPAHAAGSTVG